MNAVRDDADGGALQPHEVSHLFEPMKEIKLVEEESQRKHKLTSRKPLLRDFIYLQQIIQQDTLKTNLGHLLKLFIAGDKQTGKVEAMTKVISIHCDEC